MRVEVDAYRNNGANHVRLATLATGPVYVPDSWFATGVWVASSVGQTPAGVVKTTNGRVDTSVGTVAAPLQQLGAWRTIRQDVDRDAATTSIGADGTLLGTFAITELVPSATHVILSSNASDCWKNLKVY